MKLLSPAISRLALLRIAHIERWVANPVATQREVLQDLVTHGQYTAFGRKYGFNELFNIRKFKEAVPISEYEDLKPFIDRLLEGEDQLLWNTPVRWFAKSSGTTSDKSKFIPITKESLEDCHYQAAKDVLALYYKFNNDSDIDLLVDFKPMDISKYAEIYYNLKFGLQNLLNRPIDLLEQKAIKNPFFLQQLNKEKKLVYGH